MVSSLRRSLSVVPGCLGNSRLCQQWACTSVGADCLGNGGRPSPMELCFKKTSSLGAFGIAILFVALRYPKHCVPGISWSGSLFKSHSVSSSALSRHSLPVQQGTRTSAVCAECCVALLCYHAGCRRSGQSLCLASRVSFIPGNFPVLWATKIRLEIWP